MKPQILRDLRFLFSLVVACGPAGVPGAGGPGRCVCRWAAARPSDGVACGATGVPGAGGPVCGAGLLCGARPLCVPVGGGPPARSPHASCARSGRSRGPPWPCRHPPAPRPGLAPRSPARPRHRPWEPKPGPPLPVGVMGVSRVEFLGCSGACCDKRRQSKVFFVWLSAALL